MDNSTELAAGPGGCRRASSGLPNSLQVPVADKGDDGGRVDAEMADATPANAQPIRKPRPPGRAPFGPRTLDEAHPAEAPADVHAQYVHTAVTSKALADLFSDQARSRIQEEATDGTRNSKDVLIAAPFALIDGIQPHELGQSSRAAFLADLAQKRKLNARSKDPNDHQDEIRAFLASKEEERDAWLEFRLKWKESAKKVAMVCIARTPVPWFPS
jgi:hypothetical protein